MGQEGPRSSLSFEDFIEAATSAALRATAKVAARKPDGSLDDRLRPGPIWVGIIIRDFDDVKTIGNPQQG
jgi:hypothetical protein